MDGKNKLLNACLLTSSKMDFTVCTVNDTSRSITKRGQGGNQEDKRLSLRERATRNHTCDESLV
jgi:hypothetical protein